MSEAIPRGEPRRLFRLKAEATRIKFRAPRRAPEPPSPVRVNIFVRMPVSRSTPRTRKSPSP